MLNVQRALFQDYAHIKHETKINLCICSRCNAGIDGFKY